METVHAGGMPILFGQVDAFLRPDLCVTGVVLFVIINVGLWLIWRSRSEVTHQTPASLDEQLDHYREMVRNGELEPEEFDKIKAQLENPAPPVDDDSSKDDQPPDTSIRAM